MLHRHALVFLVVLLCASGVSGATSVTVSYASLATLPARNDHLDQALGFKIDVKHELHGAIALQAGYRFARKHQDFIDSTCKVFCDGPPPLESLQSDASLSTITLVALAESDSQSRAQIGFGMGVAFSRLAATFDGEITGSRTPNYRRGTKTGVLFLVQGAVQPASSWPLRAVVATALDTVTFGPCASDAGSPFCRGGFLNWQLGIEYRFR